MVKRGHAKSVLAYMYIFIVLAFMNMFISIKQIETLNHSHETLLF